MQGTGSCELNQSKRFTLSEQVKLLHQGCLIALKLQKMHCFQHLCWRKEEPLLAPLFDDTLNCYQICRDNKQKGEKLKQEKPDTVCLPYSSHALQPKGKVTQLQRSQNLLIIHQHRLPSPSKKTPNKGIVTIKHIYI